MHLTKQQAFDADLETKKQISFTGKLDQAEDTKIVFILEEIKETILEFSQGTVRVLWMCITSHRFWIPSAAKFNERRSYFTLL